MRAQPNISTLSIPGISDIVKLVGPPNPCMSNGKSPNVNMIQMLAIESTWPKSF